MSGDPAAAAAKRPGAASSAQGNADAKRARLSEEASAAAPPATDDDEVARALGFAAFGSTKGKPVADNKTTAARGTKAHSHVRKVKQVINLKKKTKRGPQQPPQ